MKKYFFIVIIFCFLIILSTVYIITQTNIFFNKNNPTDKKIQQISINGKKLQIETAESTAKRSHGLSDRESLCPDCGMLFIFDKPLVPNFWMKDMNFSLDIIWINNSHKIIGVDTNLPPLKPNSRPIYYKPSAPVVYVLEVNSNWVATNKIKTGDMVKF